MREKKCLYCGDQFTGRKDKKFCLDACRNAYHNDKNTDKDEVLKLYYSRLKANYRTLQKCQTSSGAVTVRDLSRLGFSFDLMTHVEESEQGKTVYCFDLGYRVRDGDRVEIVQ